MLNIINDLEFNVIILIGIISICIVIISTGIITAVINGHYIKKYIADGAGDLSEIQSIEKKLDGKLKTLADEMEHDFKIDLTDEVYNYKNISQGEEEIVEEVLNEYLT